MPKSGRALEVPEGSGRQVDFQRDAGIQEAALKTSFGEGTFSETANISTE